VHNVGERLAESVVQGLEWDVKEAKKLGCRKKF